MAKTVVLHSYNTNVPKELGVSIPQELCFGIETEFLNTTDAQLLWDTLCSTKGRAIFKQDTSCGIELVSIPLRPAEMLNYVSLLDISGLSVDDKCGVHIHISRKYITQSQLGGLVVFMNHPANIEYVEYVAGRKANKYCKVLPGKTETISYDRYEMVNLTNRETVEIRIFAGTNNTQVLFGYVMWLAQLLKWLGTCPTNYSFVCFLQYTANNPLVF